MKKSFDQNVPRLRPRLKWQTTTSPPQENMDNIPPPAQDTPPVLDMQDNPHAALANLAAAVKNKTAQREETPLSALEAIRKAIGEEKIPPNAVAEPSPSTMAQPPVALVSEQELAERRIRLKERLKAARETPGFLPLPPTALQAGELAVERIAQLQIEISKLRDENLQLTQSLEAARRRAEEATEIARMRMEEMERVSNDMNERSKLMSELEEEMLAIETERDETLILLQETRAELRTLQERYAQQLAEFQKREEALHTSLEEEEALANELETLRMQAEQLTVAHQLLSQDRASLASQVEELKQERKELLEARKALESVHKALSKAVIGKN